MIIPVFKKTHINPLVLCHASEYEHSIIINLYSDPINKLMSK